MEATVEIVKIPRFTVWNEESIVFEQVQHFAWMCSKLCANRSATHRETPPVFVLRKLSETTQLAVEDIQVLFRLLKEVAFHYREPERKRCIPDISWCREPIITDEMYNKWSKEKRQLKKAIKEHETIYEKLTHKQKNCIETMKKVKKYRNLIDIATHLEDCDADTEDIGDNKITVDEIKTHLLKKMASQEKHISSYNRVLREEREIRRHVLDLTESLETDIRQRMRDKVELGLTYLKQAATFGIRLEADFVAKNLYTAICRTYSFQIAQEGADLNAFRQPLPVPWHVESGFLMPDYACTYSNGKLGLVVTESKVHVDEKDYLKLNKDDIVKQKFVSADGTLGFGWTKPSTFSMKKWGFYPADTLSLHETTV